MPYIHDSGKPTSPVWVITEEPANRDEEKKFLFSSPTGWVFRGMLEEAGIKDYYITSRKPDTEHKDMYRILENDLNHYKPPIIIPLEAAGKFLCSQLSKSEFSTRKKILESDSEIEKYAGSLLTSPLLKYPHYIIPTFGPKYIIQNWSERDIVTSLDLGKARDELEFLEKHGTLQPLPCRDLRYEIEDFEELCGYLRRFREAKLLSNDIETVYPNRKSKFWPHPGYPITIGLADSKDFGISFNLFREDIAQTRIVWRMLDDILCNVPQLGQNFFNFDLARYEMLGFQIPMANIRDTIIRHHLLWPELPHTLQFQTRQYTREPYYKDEGHRWSMKDMKSLRRYNCLDVCVTFEVFNEQEKEFQERQHLL